MGRKKKREIWKHKQKRLIGLACWENQKERKKKGFARIEEGLSAGRDQETLGRELIRRPDDDLSIFNFFFVCVGV